MNRPALLDLGPVRMTQAKPIPLVRLADIAPQRAPEPRLIGSIIIAMTRNEITPAEARARLIRAGLPETRASELAACALNNLKTGI